MGNRIKNVLNLYAGCGGNRKKWGGDINVTAVELNPQIADIYAHFYPNDNLIIDDAHTYLLDHYKEFDFIWSSPPCPTHSRIRKMGVLNGSYPAVYPDINLWQEITLLKHFFKGKWVVENVNLYYDPIIPPAFNLDRHFFWSNFYVPEKKFKKREMTHKKINGANHKIYGFDLSGFKCPDKRRVLRNMVSPDVGEYIFNTGMKFAIKEEQTEMF